MESSIRTKGLVFGYNPEKMFQFPDLDILKGEQWLITGRSGCGKTTLLHILLGILSPHEGEVSIYGTSLFALSGSARDTFRGKNMGVVFQQPHLIPHLTVKENIELSCYFSGKKYKEADILSLLQKLNIGNILKAYPSQLSAGEQQRVAIARAVIHSPRILIADEPTSSLDDENCHEVISLLQSVSEMYQSTLLVVTHDSRVKEAIKNRTTLDFS
ncbi:MAG: ABC transporter ATP-binding protein [Bacteroidia bacterium]|nr:ABC transporter ATP-binding protein [Bacteroidia bacterium]